ncbi:hypothetical protein IWZ01DRAFT_160095 [Phyllosticta capitalensis]
MCGLRMPIQQGAGCSRRRQLSLSLIHASPPAARGIVFDTDGHPPILLHHCRFIFLMSLRPTAWLREVLVAEPTGLPGRLLHARPAWLIMAEAVFCGLQRARACTMYRQFMYRRLGSLWVVGSDSLSLWPNFGSYLGMVRHHEALSTMSQRLQHDWKRKHHVHPSHGRHCKILHVFSTRLGLCP